MRCESCGHLGAPASVEPVQNGMVLVCANCGQKNRMAFGALKSGSPNSGPESGSQRGLVTPSDSLFADGGPAARVSGESEMASSLDVGLLPEAGVGERCVKCVALLFGATHCPRCGLAVGVLSADEDLAPWGIAIEQQTEEARRWASKWRAFVETRDPSALRFSVEEAIRADLVEGVIRSFRKHLVSHPDDEIVIVELRRIGDTLRAHAVTVQAQGEVALRSDLGQTRRILRRLTWATIGVAIVVLSWIASLFLVG